MTVYYVDPAGSNSYTGLSPVFTSGTTGPKATLNGAEDIPVVAGDIVHVRPATYRELLTVDVSGGNTYSTGTVSVTNGSAIVTGSGTTFTGNVYAGGMFQSTVLASGTDGVTTAVTATSHTFTSTAGNFQAGHVGMVIRINTIGAYVITARASATSITIARADNSSFLMVAGTGLTYDVGPESPYRISTVDSATQFTLAELWSGPTFTGLAYLTWQDIEYRGDYVGLIWPNPTNAVVRITGSDNDTTQTRANCVVGSSISYRTLTNVTLDMATDGSVSVLTGSNWVLKNLYFGSQAPTTQVVYFNGTGVNNTVSNCVFVSTGNFCIRFNHSGAVSNTGHLVENIIFFSGSRGISIDRIGGVSVRNCLFYMITIRGISISSALTVGQTCWVNNSKFVNVATGLYGTTSPDLTETYCTFWNCSTNRTNVLTAATSNIYPPLYDTRWFFQLVNAAAAAQLATPFDLASYSALLNVAGLNPPGEDMRGTAVQGAQREWGPLEYDSTLRTEAREAALVAGGMVIG